MKEIELTQGYTAIVDDDDYERVITFNWHWWAGRIQTRRGGGRTLQLGRFILDINDPKVRVTNMNNDKLDCRKSNLVIMSNSSIAQRKTKHKTSSSRFRGVCWVNDRHKWQVRIRSGGKSLHIGYFEDEITAAYAYDDAVKKFHGTGAYLNFPDTEYEQVMHSKLPVRSGVRKSKQRVTTSRFKGVHQRQDGRWIATFTINGEVITRTAKSENAAAQIYDELILKHLGSNARSNFESIWAWKRRESANRNQPEPAHKAGF